MFDQAKRLVRAIEGGDEATALALIKPGRHLNRRGQSGDTPLIAAVKANAMHLVDALLEAGAEPNGNNKFGLTPLMQLPQTKEAPGIASRLLAAGANPNLVSTKGWTALMRSTDRSIVEMLLAAGADPAPAFHYACQLRSKEIVSALIEAGAKVDQKALDVSKHNPSVRRFLLEVTGAAKTPADAMRDLRRTLPKLARSEHFAEVRSQIETLFGRSAKPFKGQRGLFIFPAVQISKITPALGMSPFSTAWMVATHLSAAARDHGVSLFAKLSDDTDLEAPERLNFVLLPRSEPLMIPLVCGTNANLGGDTHDVINALAAIAKDDPFDIICCGHDTLHGVLRAPSRDPKRLAERLLDLCPDLADAGADPFGTSAQSAPHAVTLFAEDLKADPQFMLWWD